MKRRHALKVLAAWAAEGSEPDSAIYRAGTIRRALSKWQRCLHRLGGYNPLASRRSWRLSYQIRGKMMSVGVRPSRRLWRATLESYGERVRGLRAQRIRRAVARARRAA